LWLADDSGYSLLRGRINDQTRLATCELDSPDWSLLAGAHDLSYISADDPEQLAATLRTAHRGARLIRVDALQIAGDWSQA